MTPWRLYIASCEAERLERVFAFDAGFSVLGSSRWGADALREINRLCPDALILDSALAGLDGIQALQALEQLIAPPRVLFLQRTEWAEPASRADRTLTAPWTAETLLAMAHETASLPLPKLAAARENERLSIADALLDELRLSPRLKGRAYIRCAVAALACAPQLAAPCSARLYPYVARRCQSTPQAVEKAIRTAVEDTWLHGSLQGIQALYGASIDADRGKPTNAEFLAMLAMHLSLRLLHQAQNRAAAPEQDHGVAAKG